MVIRLKMPEANKYDVIISGGGPAGSTAGYLLSRSGLKVLIIDKSSFPRHKLCAGLITHKTVRLLERVFGESAGSLKEKNIINFESSHYQIFCRDNLINERDMDIPFRFIDRDSYDHFLLNKAVYAGADVSCFREPLTFTPVSWISLTVASESFMILSHFFLLSKNRRTSPEPAAV